MVEIRHYTLEAIGVVGSVLISVIVALSTQIFIDSTGSQVSLLIGLVALLIGLVVTDYVNSEQEFISLSDEINNIRDISGDFTELQSNPEYRPQIQRIVSNFIEALNGHEFFQQRAETTLRDFENEMQRLANGRFRCNADSHMEPRITRDLLEVTDDNIKAVSYDEEDWWLGDSGQRYMNRHEELMSDKDVQIYRIFITPEDKRDEMREVFSWHDQNDIQWDVLDPEGFPTDFLDSVGEFVIYDGELLREGEPTRGQLENNIVVTTSSSDIDQKLSEFVELANGTELEISV